jgi:hypothetical protein
MYKAAKKEKKMKTIWINTIKREKLYMIILIDAEKSSDKIQLFHDKIPNKLRIGRNFSAHRAYNVA